MLLATAGILYLIAAILGLWSTSLLWRSWHTSRLRKRAGASPATARPRRTRLGAGVALVALPLSGAAVAAGEVVRNGFSDSDGRLVAVFLTSAAAVLLLLALGAGYVAIRFDPAHGRRRCSTCWYDMSATLGLRCPECGREAKSEKGLFRTRRAPALLIAPLMLMVGSYSLFVTKDVAENGWVAAVPTTALVAGLPWLSDELATDADGSLQSRTYGEMWGWQESLLLWRCRRIIRNSEDLAAISRAADFFEQEPDLSGGMVLPTDGDRVVINPRAMLKIIRAACEDSNAPPNVNTIVGLDFTLYSYFPARVDPSIMEESRRLIIAALKNGSTGAKNGAAGWVSLLGEDAEPVIEPLSVILRNPSEDQTLRMMVIIGLSQLAVTSDTAWAEIRWAVTCDNPILRAGALRMLNHQTARTPAVLDLARSGMNDPAARTAAAAACLYLRRSPDPCAAADEVIAMMEAHPATAVDVMHVLADKCMDRRSLVWVERLLKSADAREQEAGANAAAYAGTLGKRLLPLLHTMTGLDPGIDSRASYANMAINQIENALRYSGE